MNTSVPLALPWLGAAVLPVLLAMVLVVPPWRGGVVRLAPLAAVPALALGLTAPADAIIELPWLLLGARFGLDAIGRVFLLFTAALWIVAAVYAVRYLATDSRRVRFFAFFLVTMGGNLGLILAQDVVGFYLFFALMNFAAFGLVVHAGTTEARRAGRIYILLVILGEALILAGMLLAVHASGSLDLQTTREAIVGSGQRDLIVALLLIAFGIKAGVVPLHVWLPLAHPVAPTPASAVLSGTMIKAGLLGWLRLLPLGEEAMPGWAALCVFAGLGTAFYAVAAGLAQRDPKTVLAYSSVGQMGLLAVGLGGLMLAPAAATVLVPALLIGVVHHAFAKGTLFLAVGIQPPAGQGLRGPFMLGVGLAAVAMAGLPLTSGAVAKFALKAGMDQTASAGWVALLLPLTGAGTTLLMLRFVNLLGKSAPRHPVRGDSALWLAWAAGLAGVLAAAWTAAGMLQADMVWDALDPAASWSALWPVMGAMLLWWTWHRLGARGLTLPAGDLVVFLEALGARLGEWHGRAMGHARPWHASVAGLLKHPGTLAEPMRRLERHVVQWPMVAAALMLVMGAVLAALVLG